uniref:Uncharacterized protein n=1 Tax=Ditylenchus dipsaci TaxID=166011 RepID=A0A915DR35_9BILA
MLRELKFEPGNAYNSQVISETKAAGQKVFEHIGDNSLRKARINDQIDAIQSRIDYLANLRRTIVDNGDRDFESIDARREALALLMLHYCSGLSECMDKEDLEHKKIRTRSFSGT